MLFGKNLDDRTKLLSLMREVSEDCWCAGWLSGLEFILWDIITGGEKETGMGFVPAATVDELARLHITCDGWWAWSDDDHEEVFLSTDEWRLRLIAENREPPP